MNLTNSICLLLSFLARMKVLHLAIILFSECWRCETCHELFMWGCFCPNLRTTRFFLCRKYEHVDVTDDRFFSLKHSIMTGFQINFSEGTNIQKGHPNGSCDATESGFMPFRSCIQFFSSVFGTSSGCGGLVGHAGVALVGGLLWYFKLHTRLLFIH